MLCWGTEAGDTALGPYLGLPVPIHFPRGCGPGGSEPTRNPSSQQDAIVNSPEKDQLKNEIEMGSGEASEMRGGED